MNSARLSDYHPNPIKPAAIQARVWIFGYTDSDEYIQNETTSTDPAYFTVSMIAYSGVEGLAPGPLRSPAKLVSEGLSHPRRPASP